VNALMSDGKLEVILHFMTTHPAGKCLHVGVVKESGIDRLALDPPFFHIVGLGTICQLVTDHRFWLLEAIEI